jgi:glycosyltransferase involved in cell wall biosynthesis
MRLLSPMAKASGAYVLHQQLARHLPGYRVRAYSPWWQLLPPVLPVFGAGDVDLIHTSADYGLFFRRPGVPTVVTLHNYVCDSFMRRYSSPLRYLHYRSDLRWFLRRSLQQADAAVAVSRFMMTKVREDLGVTRPMRLIYNGVDEARFVPAPRGRRTGPFRVLFCGNLNRRKRPELLAPLAQALGAGFEVCYTAGLTGAAPLGGARTAGAARLTCLGQVDHADMPALYQTMDLLFMPSVREGFGLCVAEAMACGLPVVACRESALPELVVDAQGGFLCDVDDVSAYATAIRRLAGDPELYRQMADFNRARVEQQFTLARMVREYRDLFGELIEGRR